MKPSVILVAAIFLAFLNRSIGAEPLILQPGVPLIIAADEPEALQLAAKDLARDLAKVLGKPSPIGTSAAPGATPIIICGPSNRSVPGTFREGLSGTESHTITVRPYGNGRAVVLCGADMRGAIYACYEFSDRFLDIPPLWAYASWQPQHKDRLELPGDCALRFPSPKTPFRAWFLNDADLHYAFLKRHPEHAELFLETLLRCKANTIEGRILDGGSWKKPYSIGRDTALAQRRGLIFTHHHMVPLGASIKEWPNYWKSIRGQEPPPLDLNAPFEDFWRYHIECALTNRVESVLDHWETLKMPAISLGFWR